MVARSSLRSGLLFHGTTDVDNIVGNDPEPNPSVHSDESLVAAAREAVSPLDHADASFAAGAPSLAVAEPALSLLALALLAVFRLLTDSGCTETSPNFAPGSRLVSPTRKSPSYTAAAPRKSFNSLCRNSLCRKVPEMQ